MSEIREIEWHRFSPTVQAHGYCRYCRDCVKASKMKRTKAGWVLVCDKHAKPKRIMVSDPRMFIVQPEDRSEKK